MAISYNPICYPFDTNVGEPARSFVSRCGRYQRTKYNPSGCHMAWDRGCPRGTPIRAIVSGTIVKNGYDAYLGWHVVIRHHFLGDFWLCHFANKSNLPVGTKVTRRKTRVGTAGDSGNASGVHLHVTWYQGNSVGKAWGSVPIGDPYPFIRYDWLKRFAS